MEEKKQGFEEFDRDFQKKIFALMLKEKEFLQTYLKFIEADYFDNRVLRDLADIVFEFFKKYDRVPETMEFLNEFELFLKKEGKRIPVDEYVEVVKEIMAIRDHGKFDYVRSKVLESIKRQGMKHLILKLDIDKGDYKKFAEMAAEIAIIGDENEPKGLKTIDCGSVETEEVLWLWQNRIPLGKLTFIIGDPGIGKSFLTSDLCHHVTTGAGWPDTPSGSVEKGSVILLNAEDGLADTIVRRLEWAGADRSKVIFIEATIEGKGEERTFRLDKDLAKLEDLLKTKGDVRMVIFDPLSAYLGDVDSYRDTEVRRTLAPLVLLAEKHKVAIVAVLHMNKKQSIQAIYRVPGSIGFAGAARVI